MFTVYFENEHGERSDFGSSGFWMDKEALIQNLRRPGSPYHRELNFSEEELEELRRVGCWSFDVVDEWGNRGTRSVNIREVAEATLSPSPKGTSQRGNVYGAKARPLPARRGLMA